MSKFYDYKIKFRTFDQLLDSVSDEWDNLEREGAIEPSHLIKIATRINKELGLRVTKTKEVIIPFENWVVNLPDDIENINYAVLCGTATIINSGLELTGLQRENVNVTEDELGDSCVNDNVYITKCGDLYKIVETKTKIGGIPYVVQYHISSRISIENSVYNDRGCGIRGVIINSNFMKMNIPSGKVYLNYEGVLEDSDGNLLVVDHPLLNDYYEYAVKRRVLENLYFKGEDVERKLQLIEIRYAAARKQALGVANTPEFKEIEEAHSINRRAMYSRFYSIFV